MTGPASLAFLHGFTGAPASWDRVLEILDPPLAVDRPALVGHGRPPEASEAGTFRGEVDRLAARLRDRLPTPIHLVGYSMGGRLALGLLTAHGELFASATLIGASPGLASADEREERRAVDEDRARRLESDGLDRFLEAWRDLPLFATQTRLSADVRARREAIRRSHRADGLARALRTVGAGTMPDLRPRLPDLGIPADLVVGDEDLLYVEIAGEVAAAWAGAEVRVVPGCGHDVALESPATVAAIVASRCGLEAGVTSGGPG